MDGEREPYTLHLGDCIEALRAMPDNSVDAVVTDPPYGIRFMGKAWDGADIEERHAKRKSMQSHAPDAGPNGGHKSIAAEAGKYDLSPKSMRAFQAFSEEWSREALRVLKPGGYVLSFASPRTYHRMVCGIEDAGFEIRDCIQWVFGSGFPKSHNLDGDRKGWGTALKPAHEPIVVARKPIEGTVAANVLKWGTGALNIDGCRVGASEGRPLRVLDAKETQNNTYAGRMDGGSLAGGSKAAGETTQGRWPANLIHDGSDEVVACFPAQAGAAAPVHKRNGDKFRTAYGAFAGNIDEAGSTFHGDTGNAARFFYCAKASRADRNEGCEAFDKKPLNWSSGTQNPGSFQSEGTDKTAQNHHPTVKPTDLMRYLCRLVTPPGGVVLDPFMGSGSTGKAAMLEGFGFIGCELSPDYMAIAGARIAHAWQQAEAERVAAATPPPQGDLFGEVAA